MYKKLCACLVVFVATRLYSQDYSNLKLGQESIYFLSDERLRHHIYSLDLSVSRELYSFSKISFDGFSRYDLALLPSRQAARSRYSETVKRDEDFDLGVRNFFFSYTGEIFNLRAGIQTLDWLDTLSPQGPDFLLPVDLRRGGLSDPEFQELPFKALRISHPFLSESFLEWILIYPPTVSRLPLGENGYGYFESIKDKIPEGRQLVVSTDKLNPSIENAEAGLRILKNLGEVDLSLLGFHGYQRLPSYRLKTALSSETIGLEQYFAKTNTFGFFSSWSKAKFAGRFFGLYEPRRTSEVMSYGVGSTLIEDSGPYRHLRIGVGADYAHSQHFRWYSEIYQTQKRPLSNPEVFKKYSQQGEEDYNLVYRVTNETFKEKVLSLEGMVSLPERSFLFSPSLKAEILKDFHLSSGFKLIKSYSDQARLDRLRHSGYFFLKIDYQTKV